MKKPKKSRRLFESFMDEYTGKAEAKRVREAAKHKGTKTPTRSEPTSMSTYRVQALEAENAALRLQLAAQSSPVIVYTTNTTTPPNDFEQEYNRPETVEDEPKGRKIVLKST